MGDRPVILQEKPWMTVQAMDDGTRCNHVAQGIITTYRLGKLGVVLLLLLVEANVLQDGDLRGDAMRTKIISGKVMFLKKTMFSTPRTTTTAPRILTSPFWSSSAMVLASLPMQSMAYLTCMPSSSARRFCTGSRRNLSSGPALGRPCTMKRCWCVPDRVDRRDGISDIPSGR